MDIATADDQTGVLYHVDFRRMDSLGKSHQERSTGFASARAHAFRDATNDKARTYAAESRRQGALLFCFCCDSDGSFAPRDREFSANGRLDPSAILAAVFRNGRSATNGGRIPLSVEEGFLRLLANRAADPDSGSGIFDSTLNHSAAVTRIVAQTKRRIAFYATRGTSRSILAALSHSSC